MITVQLLGGACLRSGNAPLVGPPAQRHRIALLALVVAAWPQPLARDRAMALLWPERDVAGGRRLLNLAVHVLRAALGEGAIVSTGDGLLFDPSHLWCDLHELRAAIAADEPERVIQLYAGPLLDGFHLGESAEFGYWLEERRAELSHAYAGALRTVAERQERSGDVHGWVGTCRRLVAADPYSGVSAQALMRALDAAGDRAGAIQHAAEHARRVRADLELEPDPGVAALAERLRSAATTRRPPPLPAVRAAPAPCVAVLPFLNLGADPDDEYFADGITEDVITQLSKIRALTVIARTSVMPFKSRERNLRDVAAALGATIVLDGSVRHVGDRVRIVARLLDVESQRTLWGETYDRQLTDIFVIQSDVALHIAGALAAELSRDERARVRREPTKDVAAYRLFLQGRQWFIRFTPDSLRRAIELFQQALARDPTFALAHAHVAMAYTELAEGGAMAPEVALQRATDAAASALRLDPELGAAHCTMGHLKVVRELDWAGAEREFRRALELSPGAADTYDLYGRFLMGIGRHDEAIALLRRATELDPLAHRMDLVTALLRAGRHEEAIACAEEVLAFDAADDRAHATLGWAYVLSGRKEEGLAELERAVSLAPQNTLWIAQLGEAHALAGNSARARELLRTLEDRARTGFVSPYHFAYLYTGLGETERAMDWLERAVAQRTGAGYGIKASFLFTPLHGNPRFQALLKTMKLA